MTITETNKIGRHPIGPDFTFEVYYNNLNEERSVNA